MTGGSNPVDVLATAVADVEGPIVVTGATGWLGLVAMDLLYDALGDEAPNRVVGFASRPREVQIADGRAARVRSFDDLPGTSLASGGVLHFAFLTPDRLAGLGHDEYVARNRAITATVDAAVSAQRPAWLVVASSGAVYGSPDRDDVHPYGALKRESEQILTASARTAGATCVVPRIFSLAGPRVPRGGVYALGDMLDMAERGGPITVRAGHEVRRTYCGADEVVALAVWAAVQGRDITFDTGGDVVEVGDLALRIAATHGLGRAAVRREEPDGAGPDVYAGAGTAMGSLALAAGLRLRSLDELVAASVTVRS